MRVIILCGPPAVGKLTVALELSKKLEYPILDNHQTIDIALIFAPFGSQTFLSLVQGMRFLIIETLLRQRRKGLIMTASMPNIPAVKAFYRNLGEMVKSHGGKIHYVHLYCELQELKRRVVKRGAENKRKINTVQQLKKAMKEFDFSGKGRQSKGLVIDNTKLSPRKAAEQVIKYYKLAH